MTKQGFDPQIAELQPMVLAGMALPMSLVRNRTRELWSSFMARKKELRDTVQGKLYSLQVYPAGFLSDPESEFVKWALMEVKRKTELPTGFRHFDLPGGKYAVFHYMGPAGDPRIYQFIFGSWLPSSGYTLDDRPHFEVLDQSYDHTDPKAEEDIWIPITKA